MLQFQNKRCFLSAAHTQGMQTITERLPCHMQSNQMR